MKKIVPPPTPQMTHFLTSKTQKTPPLPATRREKKQYFFLVEALKVNKSTAAYDHQVCLQNGWLSSSVAVKTTFDFLGTKNR